MGYMSINLIELTDKLKKKSKTILIISSIQPVSRNLSAYGNALLYGTTGSFIRSLLMGAILNHFKGSAIVMIPISKTLSLQGPSAISVARLQTSDD